MYCFTNDKVNFYSMIRQSECFFIKRIINIAVAVLYAIFYHFIYVNYCSFYFSYMGAEYNPLSEWAYYSYILTASLPFFFYKGFTTVASGISLFTYILVYVPLLLAVYATSCMQTTEGNIMILELALFQVLMFSTDNKCIFKQFFLSKTIKQYPFRYLEILTIVCMIALIASSGTSLRFVNFLTDSDTMYDLRADYSQNRAAWSGYLINWVKSGMLPILLLVYLKRGNLSKIIFAVIGYILIFMLDMQKITFLMPFVIIILFYAIEKGKNIRNSFHFILIGALIIIPYFLYHHIDNATAYTIATVLIMRTQCVAGWIGSIYFNFFNGINHPFTYYTHINVVNLLTNAYPYSKPLGYAVSQGDMNANANFLMTDGYAALGLMGIPTVTIILILVKSALNSISLKYSAHFVIIAFLSAISAMMNVSIFTAILSCGLLILYILFAKIDIKELRL